MNKHQINLLLTFCALTLVFILHFFFKLSLWWLVPVFLIHVAVLIYGVVVLSFNYFFKSHSNGTSNKKQIALTFDDGPCSNSALLLDVLKEKNIPATFFCIGKNVDANPELAKRMMNEGHIIGNHTYTHAHTFDFYSTQKVKDELTETNQIIEKTIGKKPLLFRPPNGVSNPMIAKAIKTLGLQSIAWNIRTFDTQIKDSNKILQKIKRSLQPGSIILMHDTMPHTVNLVSNLLTLCKEEQYEIVSLDKLLNITVYE